MLFFECAFDRRSETGEITAKPAGELVARPLINKFTVKKKKKKKKKKKHHCFYSMTLIYCKIKNKQLLN
jgi:hypothetical protein